LGDVGTGPPLGPQTDARLALAQAVWKVALSADADAAYRRCKAAAGEDMVLTMGDQAAGYDARSASERRVFSRLWWKRPLDVAVAGGLLLILGPVLALLALAVRLESPGPALYKQERVGLHGRRFLIWKLRTMKVDNDDQAHRKAAEDWFKGHRNGNGFKSLEDPRITRVGRVLRRTSLDELPQMFNVIRGDMSIVGPRPAIPYELDLYEPEYFQRQEVPPGITGLWQVSGRETVSAGKMMELDLVYVRDASLSMDLKILVKTGPAVLGSALRSD
jgi:lipopolysaccharide/colanic/teichoic acid biosynthesis glycosyltransferase